jgi:hypothetical protein
MSVRLKSEVFLRLIHWALRHEDVWGSGGMHSQFLTSELDGSERWAVSTAKSPAIATG